MSIARSNICKSEKSAMMIQTVCEIISRNNASDFNQLNDKIRTQFIYDDCGLSSIIVFDINYPYTLRLHPLRPFLENKLQFASTPQPYNQSPFIVLAKLLKENTDTVTLYRYPTSLGLNVYHRTYWAKSCPSLDRQNFAVAAAQTQTERFGEIGSNLTALPYSFLTSADLIDLANSVNIEETYKSKFLSLSKAVVNKSYVEISTSLNLDSGETRDLLLSRLNDEENYHRLRDEIDPVFYGNTLALVGFLQSDIEHTIAMASLPSKSVFEFEKVHVLFLIVIIIFISYIFYRKKTR